MAEKTQRQLTVIQQIDAGIIDLSEFTYGQVHLIKGLVKNSYLDGYYYGYNDLEGKIYKALNGETDG